jgi:secreted Zn-dependent insulinase-like peptidase
LTEEYLVYNFGGIYYNLGSYISTIMKHLYPENILLNKNLEKYFRDTINEMKESLENFKYNSPYTIASKFLNTIISNIMTPRDKINFLNNLTFENFLNQLNDCLKYTEEYYIILGIKKNGIDFNFNYDDEYNLIDDKYIYGLIEMTFLHKKYILNTNDVKKNLIEPKIKLKNLKIEQLDINPDEVNNCLIRYWCLNKIDISILEKNTHTHTDTDTKTNSHEQKELINKKIYEIVSSSLIISILTEMLNEPLFDKIRTIDKLGYIVKADDVVITNNDEAYFFITFLVQSSYSIKRINSSIDDFIDGLDTIFNTEEKKLDEYFEKFKLIKKSKLINYQKDFDDLVHEINNYLDAIISKFFIFDLNSLYLKVCKQIDFNKDIKPILLYLIESTKNKKYYEIVLDKKN